MLELLTWFATTPEGERLGQLAAAEVQVTSQPRPWWAFPLEPLHWFWTLSSASPHSFYTAAFYLGLALLVAGWALRRAGPRAALAWLISLVMLLVGGLQAESWAYTAIPHGMYWRVPEGAGYRLANLHSHTQASGGSLMPEDLLRWHLAHGFSVVGITDSNKVYPGMRARRAGLPVVVVPGEEYRGATHLVMLNVGEPIRPDQADVPEAIRRARAQGGVVIAAHPWTSRDSSQQLADWGVHGFEICSGRAQAEPETREICRRQGLAALGNLDYRQGNSAYTATVLPAWADSAEKVQQALLRGECATLYVADWVEPARFELGMNLRHRWQSLQRDGGGLLLPGLLFWLALGRLARGRLRPRPGRYLGLIFGMAVLTGALGLWSVWWRFKTGWFPQVELALGVWAVACPLCLYLAWSETAASN